MPSWPRRILITSESAIYVKRISLSYLIIPISNAPFTLRAVSPIWNPSSVKSV
ncbi:hypothetical protein LguiA_019550 [Lonicera macranthoides]